MKLTLEQRIQKFKEVDIYPVISSEFCNDRPVVQVLQSIADGGAKIVQLREKNMSKAKIFKLALEYRRLTAWHDMLLIINDHVDIAVAAGADGVHLGQDDLPVFAAKKVDGSLLYGVSTHNVEEAEMAIAAGAGYINIGPVYPTQTKKVNCGALGLEMLDEVVKVTTVPFSVMGGIKEEKIPELLAHGAKHIAMVTEITQAEDITARVKALRSRF